MNYINCLSEEMLNSFWQSKENSERHLSRKFGELLSKTTFQILFEVAIETITDKGKLGKKDKK